MTAEPAGRGGLLFARFAYPPNALGYCGPDAYDEILQRVDAGAAGPGLRQLVARFAGAWPYLRLIADANGIDDALDPAVVEAYWIGNRLLDRVAYTDLAESVRQRFRPLLPYGTGVEALLPDGVPPSHAFHVFAVYPWVGLLRSHSVEQPLFVLDRCRIRAGRVVALAPDSALVRFRPLAFDGRRIGFGPPRVEVVRTARDGYALTPPLRVGGWCAAHWDWACQPLTPDQLRALNRYTARALAAVNGTVQHSPALAG